MRINTNIGALTAANSLTKVNDKVRASADKLSSGFRINKASDDAAGLGVANLFRADIRALTQAQRNAEQATSVFSIAEGGANSIQGMLERMKELAAQSAADAVDDTSRGRIDVEFQALKAEILRVTTTTEFQKSLLLQGGYGATITSGAITGGSVSSSGGAQEVTFTQGAGFISASNGAITQTVAYTDNSIGTLNFSALGVQLTTNAAATSATITGKSMTVTAGSGTFMIGAARNPGRYNNPLENTLVISGSVLDLRPTTLTVAGSVTSLTNAQTALGQIDVALGKVADALGAIGAGQNRLANAIDNIKSTVLNYQAAESTIRDLDMAAEMVTYSKNQILAQAGTAMLAQANQAGQGILKLLQ